MSSLDHEMERVGRLIAADQSLIVEIRGAEAYATTGRVVLPSIERFEALGVVGARRMLHGLVDHECGHAADTDFGVVRRAQEESKLLKYALNAIEDGYVEARRGLLFNGSRFNLTQKNRWFWETDLDRPSARSRMGDPSVGLIEKFLLGLTMVLRPYGGCTIDDIEAADPRVAGLLRKAWSIVGHTSALASRSKQTAECLRYARAVVELLNAEPDLSTGDEENPSLLVRFEAADVQAPLSPEEAVTGLMQAVLEQEPDHRPYVVFDPSFDLERDFTGEHSTEVAEEYERLRQEADTVAGSLASTFEAALRDRQERRITHHLDEEGEVDTAMLGEYAVGACDGTEIWADYRAEDESGKAAVAVLIDCSGSMHQSDTEGHSRSELARLCAIACHEALARAQVPHEINGFTTILDKDMPKHPWAFGLEASYRAHFDRLRTLCIEAANRGTDLSLFARTSKKDPTKGLQIPIYGVCKAFDGGDGRGLVHIGALSNNLDGEAILWQARRLARRPERRKVLLALSDGYPAGSHNLYQGQRYLSEAVTRVLECGIEVYGIGIQSDAVKDFYPHWWVCRDLGDLPTVMFQALMETIVTTGNAAWGETLR